MSDEKNRKDKAIWHEAEHFPPERRVKPRPTPVEGFEMKNKIDYEVTFFTDANGETRWRMFSTANKEAVASSGESYKNKNDCIEIIGNIAIAFAMNRVSFVDLTEGKTPSYIPETDKEEKPKSGGFGYAICHIFHKKHWREIERKKRSDSYTTVYYKCAKCGENQRGYEIKRG